MREINVVITMDCEPTKETTNPKATGPRDFAHSERAITGYFEIAKSYGFPVTYFVHPETMIVQHDIFRDLKAQGACVGLHMHPWKYSQWRYGGERFRAHYGELSETDQIALLSESIALWREAMGERPLYFRPGTFSANDAVFSVLAELGFRGGSVSAPGRVFKEIRAMWALTELDPHRAHRTFRNVAGDLDFANMPLSADVSNLMSDSPGRQRPADFRPDVDWPGRFGISYRTIAENILGQVTARAPKIPVLNSISHNNFEYRDRSEAACQRFVTMLDEMVAACERAGVRPVGTTVAAITDQVLALPPEEPPFAYI
jgi:hypothetical protein